MAGVVVDVGEGVTGIATGSRIAGWQFGGDLAEYAVAKADDVIALPDGIDDSMAACALVDYLTAHYALFVRGCLRPGETVLALGAAGGVGQAAVQLASSKSARVLAVVWSRDKAARVLELGAAETVELEPDGPALRDQLRAMAVDGGPSDTFQSIVRCPSEPASPVSRSPQGANFATLSGISRPSHSTGYPADSLVRTGKRPPR